MPLTLKNASGEDVSIPTAEETSEMITGAVKAHLEKATKKLSSDLTASIGNSLAETLTAYEAKRQEEAAAAEAERAAHAAESEGKAGKGGKPKDADVENSPIVKGMQKQLAEATKKIKEAEERAAAEKAKQRDGALRQQLTEQLGKHGVDPKRMVHALSYLVDGTKTVRYSDDGDTIVFKDADGSDLDLTTGLKGWAQSDEAKIYLPPRGASGSGDRPAGKSTATTQAGKLEPGTLGRSILNLIDPASGSGLI